MNVIFSKAMSMGSFCGNLLKVFTQSSFVFCPLTVSKPLGLVELTVSLSPFVHSYGGGLSAAALETSCIRTSMLTAEDYSKRRMHEWATVVVWQMCTVTLRQCVCMQRDGDQTLI